MNTQTPPKLSEIAKSQTSFGAVLRDVGIIFALSFVGGLVIGVAVGATRSDQVTMAVGCSNILFGIVGFTIAGCLARGNRWHHLAYVTLSVWLASLVNIPLGVTTFEHWFVFSPLLWIMMAIGGGISFIFKSR